MIKITITIEETENKEQFQAYQEQKFKDSIIEAMQLIKKADTLFNNNN